MWIYFRQVIKVPKTTVKVYIYIYKLLEQKSLRYGRPKVNLKEKFEKETPLSGAVKCNTPIFSF